MRGYRFLSILCWLMVGFAGGWFTHHYVLQSRPLADIQEAFRREQYELCIKLANQRLRETSDRDTEALLWAARSHIKLRHWQDALRLFNQTVLRDEEDFIGVSRAYFALNRNEEALKTCQQALKYSGPSARLLEIEARLLANTSRYQAALATAERLRKYAGKELIADLISGLINYSTGNYSRAAVNLKAALERSPNLEGQSPDFPATTRADVLLFLADSLRSSEKFDEAEKYGRAWHEVANSPDSAYFVARCARERGDLSLQEEWLMKSLSLNANFVPALADLANKRLAERKYDEARSYAEKAQTVDPSHELAKRVIEAAGRLSKNPSAKEGTQGKSSP